MEQSKKYKAFLYKIFQNFSKSAPTVNLAKEVFELRRRVKELEKPTKAYAVYAVNEKAHQLSLRHNKMLNFVSQHQELGEGKCYVFRSSHMSWCIAEAINYYPERVVMTKETADLMLEAIENGSLDLS